jgi:hypothetical protein
LEAFTPYADVNALLQQLLDGARAALGEQFAGMYLYGSLASGDFNPATSDVDFVVVTEGALPAERVAALEALHTRLWAEGGRWAGHLEGSYVPREALRRYDPARSGVGQVAAVPQVNEGRFYVGGHGSDWVIQRHVIRKYGAALAGPPPATLIDPVTPVELRQAVAGILRQWWAMVPADPGFLRRADYQAFAVLTMCRALHALAPEHEGAIVSKPAAARWARDALPARWRPLIDQAASWQPGMEMNRADEIGELIRYTLSRADEAGV